MITNVEGDIFSLENYRHFIQYLAQLLYFCIAVPAWVIFFNINCFSPLHDIVNQDSVRQGNDKIHTYRERETAIFRMKFSLPSSPSLIKFTLFLHDSLTVSFRYVVCLDSYLPHLSRAVLFLLIDWSEFRGRTEVRYTLN